MSSKRARRLAGSLCGDRRGTSAVEFAIIAPVFIALLLGVFELGWALHCNQSVDWAVQTAARQLVSTPTMTNAQLTSSVKSMLTNLDNDPNAAVTVSLTEDPSGASPRLAHVSASYVHSISVPFIKPVSYTYNTTSTMVLNP